MNAALVQPASTGPAHRVAAARGSVINRWMTERPIAVTLLLALAGALLLAVVCSLASPVAGAFLALARRIWPRAALRRFAAGHGLFMLICATK